LIGPGLLNTPTQVRHGRSICVAFLPSAWGNFPIMYIIDFIQDLLKMPKSLGYFYPSSMLPCRWQRIHKTKILNDFNMLQIFFVASVFGTIPALYISEHDINRRFTVGQAGYHNKPLPSVHGAVIDIRFHSLRIQWKRTAG